MNYINERSLFYYFMMRGVTDSADSRLQLWKFVAKSFGVRPKDVKEYGELLKAPVLDNFGSAEEIRMYNNYIDGFCRNLNEFGKTATERAILDIQALALQKTEELFGDTSDISNRQRVIARNFGRSSTLAVLYSLQVMFFNRDKKHIDYVTEILTGDLTEEKNSDAGFILLTLRKDRAADVAAEMCTLPDLLLRTDVLKYLTKKYGTDGELVYKGRTIGF